jgi:gliding motility-associated-like protein
MYKYFFGLKQFWGLIFNLAVVYPFLLHAQNTLTQTAVWQNANLHELKVFKPNRGQVEDIPGYSAIDILYIHDEGTEFYFRKNGISIAAYRGELRDDSERIASDRRNGIPKTIEEVNVKRIIHRKYIHMVWENSNPNPEIIVLDSVAPYWNYPDPLNLQQSINYVPGFRKLLYKNVYPNIDLEFTVHPERGIKYEIRLHPGANPSDLKMRYDSISHLQIDSFGNLEIWAEGILLTDHAPSAYDDMGQPIACDFTIDGHTVEFELDAYDSSRPLIIDPWLTGSFMNQYIPVEISKDSADNVYVYGWRGIHHQNMILNHFVQKYSATGILQWTFLFQFQHNINRYSGDIITNKAGNSYISNGLATNPLGCRVFKFDTNGQLTWTSGVSPNLYENWRLNFNCDESVLLASGCANGCCNIGGGVTVDTLNGIESNPFSHNNLGDIIAAIYGRDDYFYTVTTRNNSLNPPMLSKLDPANGFQIMYSAPIARTLNDGWGQIFGPVGYNAISGDCDYIWLNMGDSLIKRDAVTGVFLGNVRIPSGIFKGNSGIALDMCGNIYVGSTNGVYAFNGNLMVAAFYPTPFPVTDLILSDNNTLYACGGQQNQAGFLACFQASIPYCNSLIDIQITNPSCSGGFSTATANARLCDGPFTYVWNTQPLQTGPTATGLLPGTYSITVTGTTGCMKRTTFQVGTSLDVQVIPTNPTCAGGSNGSAMVTVQNGSPQYAVQWSTQPVQFGIIATGLQSGSYSVTVTDSMGCQTTRNFVLSAPALISIQDSIVNPICHNYTTGSIFIQSSGGTPNYTYSWNTQPIRTTQHITGMVQGTYIVTITDLHGCVSYSPPLIIQAPQPLQNQIQITPESCPGRANGTATANVSGGTPGYTYYWFTQTLQTTQMATGLSAGSYSVNILDVRGCSLIDTVIIPFGSGPSAYIPGDTLLCFGDTLGMLQVQVMGGTPPFTYTWNVMPLVTTAAIGGLSAGTYSLLLTDSVGCDVNLEGIVHQPSPLQLITQNNPTRCFGESSGSSIAQVSGGTPGYSYVWSSIAIQTTAIATGLSSGSYTLDIYDAHQCLTRDTLIIQSPVALQSQIATTPESCIMKGDGTLQLTPTGGIPPYAITWNTQPIQTSFVLSGLNAGMYTGALTDSVGCVLPLLVQIGILPPITVQQQISAVSCYGGANGSIVTTVTGGQPGYQYQWIHDQSNVSHQANALTAGTYTLTVEDQNQCNVSAVMVVPSADSIIGSISTTPVPCNGSPNGNAQINVLGGRPPFSFTWNTLPVQTNTIATGLSEGSISVMATDIAGCQVSLSAWVHRRQGIQTQISSTPVSCFGAQDGMISLQTTGGSLPYSYTWLNLPNTGPVLTQAGVGTYTVFIQDHAFCTDTLSLIMTQPDSMQVTALADSIPCPNTYTGQAFAQVSGGTAPYFYHWNSLPPQSSDTLQNVRSGLYQITVQDTRGCLAQSSIRIHEPDTIAIMPIIHSVSCYGAQDGEISIIVQGGSPPYQYSWSTGDTGMHISNLTSGSYSVIVTDHKQCNRQFQFQVSQPDSLTGVVQVSQPSCNLNSPDGTACLNILGGTQPYTYVWQNLFGHHTACADSISPGMYTVAVVDANGCSYSENIVLDAPDLPTAFAGNDTFMCENSGGVPLFAYGSGGHSPYTFEWSPNNGSLSSIHSATPNANPDTSTLYSVRITDAAGCISQIVHQFLKVSPLPIADAGSDLNYCKDGPAVFLQGAVLNSSGSYSVTWTPSQAVYCDTCLMTYATPDTTTIITLYVHDNITGCTNSTTILDSLSTAVIHVKPRPLAYAGHDHSICEFDSVQLCGTAAGAGPNYSYHWSPMSHQTDTTLACIQVSPAHSMQYLLVTESDGCYSIADTLQITVKSAPQVDAGNTKHVCLGDSVMLQGIVQQGTSTSFTWSPSSSMNDASILTPNASPTQTQWFTLQAMQGNCAGPSDSVLVIVHPRPIISTHRDTTICMGEGIYLQGACTNCDASVRYAWSPGAGLSSSQVPNPYANPSVSTVYTLTVSTGTGSSTCTTTQALNINVNPIPHAEILADTNVVCEGDSLTLSVKQVNPAYQYIWHDTTGSIGTGSNIHISAQISQAYQLVTTLNICRDTALFPITVHPRPEAKFITSQPKGCVPHTLALQNVSANADFFIWEIEGQSEIRNERNPAITFTEPGNYSIQLIAVGNGGCMDTVYSEMDIQVRSKWQPSIKTIPELPATFSMPAPPVYFELLNQDVNEVIWHFGDGNIARDKKVKHTYQQPGSYDVYIEPKSDAVCENRMLAGTIHINTSNLFIPNVFTPNNDGVTDYFKIEYNGEEAFHISIFDRWGNKVFTTYEVETSWDGRDPKGEVLSEGVYFYTLNIGDKLYTGTITLLR